MKMYLYQIRASYRGKNEFEDLCFLPNYVLHPSPRAADVVQGLESEYYKLDLQSISHCGSPMVMEAKK